MSLYGGGGYIAPLAPSPFYVRAPTNYIIICLVLIPEHSPAPGRTSQWSAIPSATPDTRAKAIITSAVVAMSKKAPSGP